MIAIGSDHAGFILKKAIIEFLSSNNLKFNDYGTYDQESCDYPVYAEKVARAVVDGGCEKGIVICGTGIGISIAANKIPGIRAALCSDVYSAKMSRQHNNANVLALGARVIGEGLAIEIVKTWLNEDFCGDKHERRVNMISEIEKRNLSKK